MNPARYEARQTVTFTSQSFDRDGSLASHDWAFGDGATATGPTVTHAYQADGSYRVKLTVVDDRGAVDESYRTVTIRSRPPYVRAQRTRTAPHARVYLVYRAMDVAGIARAEVVVYRGQRALRRFVREKGLVSGANSVRYRAPRKPGELGWCVQATDAFGHRSEWSCASLSVVRPRRR